VKIGIRQGHTFGMGTNGATCTYRKIVKHFESKKKILGKVNQSRQRLEVPRGFQEVKAPKLRDNDPGWW